ncbi:hypothetical protein ACN2AS_10990 [Serratia liquefaciens]|uniref:hypothetical protein n=1 Tax=Serratia liquefaciens TaxID=614 RepID=UPI0011F265A4|nr:hypothetical protein [Serratia liquefaciens]QIC86923.1 hypothetical protein F0336_10980 [Serratia liquefaciens]
MSKSIADLIKSVEIHVQAHREAVDSELAKDRHEAEQEAQQALDDLIIKRNQEAEEQNKEQEQGRKSKRKSRGIALVHSAQGGPANMRADSLLMKSKGSGPGLRKVNIEICKSGVTILTPEQEANMRSIINYFKIKGMEQ